MYLSSVRIIMLGPDFWRSLDIWNVTLLEGKGSLQIVDLLLFDLPVDKSLNFQYMYYPLFVIHGLI